MKLEHTATVKCSLEKASAYFNNLSEYCQLHTLKGVTWTAISPDTFKETMSMGPIKTESVYQVKLMPSAIHSHIISGEGQGTQQTVNWVPKDINKIAITWLLEPQFVGKAIAAVHKMLGPKNMVHMMQSALKKSAQLDIDHLERK